MTTHDKVISKQAYNDQTTSIGFRRWSCLPKVMRRNFDQACFIKTETTNIHDYAVAFFQGMTEMEFGLWVNSK